MLLVYIRQYFEYFVMFKKMDTSGDNRLGLDEFKAAVPMMEKWGVKITDPEAEFKKMDLDGMGHVLFDEFSHYSIEKALDLDTDIDDAELDKNLVHLKKDKKTSNEVVLAAKKANRKKKQVNASHNVEKDDFLRDIKISDIDWKVINDNLPIDHNEEDKNKRKIMFKQFDPNGNGYLSLAEIDKGFNDMGEKMRVVYLAKAVMMRAF